MKGSASNRNQPLSTALETNETGAVSFFRRLTGGHQWGKGISFPSQALPKFQSHSHFLFVINSQSQWPKLKDKQIPVPINFYPFRSLLSCSRSGWRSFSRYDWFWVQFFLRPFWLSFPFNKSHQCIYIVCFFLVDSTSLSWPTAQARE